MSDALLYAVEDRRAAVISLTQDLVRIPTLNPPGESYLEICEALGKYLGAKGFEVHLIRAKGTPGDSDRYPRWNMIARYKGGQPGETVHFNGHHDVVEVGQGWTFDPFGGEVCGDRIYGRGTCDMKGGIAASVIAAEAFIATHPAFAGAIEISVTADEESGGYGGVAYLAEKGWFSPERVQHVIIPEPLHKDRVCLGHRGVWWAELETHGHIAHGSMPFLGECAVRHMGAIMAEMEESYFPTLAARHTDMPVIPDGARHPTLNINALHGGASEQETDYTGLPAACVPDRARMVIDRRFIAEEPLDVVKAEFQEMLARAQKKRPFEYTLTDLFEVHPSMTSPDAPVVAAVSASVSDVLGKEPDFVASPGTYDQKHIDRIGRLKNCIAYGPGILDLAHQPDEWIGIDDMLDSAKVMARTLERLLVKT